MCGFAFALAAPRDPSFIDAESWRLTKNGSWNNDLGDSKTVLKYG